MEIWYNSRMDLAALIRQISRDEELPCRCQTWPADTVDAIWRYGGMVGSVVARHERLARGMDLSRNLIRQTEERGASFKSGTVILAGELTGGKGRFQRVWHAPPGGLWLTLIMVNTLLPQSSRLYPLAAGIACCEAVRHYGLPAHLKWVNDLQVGGRKIAGILCETMVGPCYGEEYILLGLGINVNNEVFPAEIASASAALKTLLGTAVDLKLFAARLLVKLAWNIGLLHYEEQQRLLTAGGGFAEDRPVADSLVLSRFRQLCDSIGRRVLFGYDVQKQPQYEAQTLGIDEAGALILQLPDGLILAEQGGEIVYLD